MGGREVRFEQQLAKEITFPGRTARIFFMRVHRRRERVQSASNPSRAGVLMCPEAEKKNSTCSICSRPFFFGTPAACTHAAMSAHFQPKRPLSIRRPWVQMQSANFFSGVTRPRN